jgi:hypothetical protein
MGKHSALLRHAGAHKKGQNAHPPNSLRESSLPHQPRCTQSLDLKIKEPVRAIYWYTILILISPHGEATSFENCSEISNGQRKNAYISAQANYRLDQSTGEPAIANVASTLPHLCMHASSASLLTCCVWERCAQMVAFSLASTVVQHETGPRAPIST